MIETDPEFIQRLSDQNQQLMRERDEIECRLEQATHEMQLLKDRVTALTAENVTMRDALRHVEEYAFHPERSLAQQMTEAERLSAMGFIATAALGNIKH